MEIRNLQTFLQAATTLNFTKTAEMLGYTQPNVSFQIRQLEDELGVPLFERIGKNVLLTQYGEALIPYAKKTISDVLEIKNTIKPDKELNGNIHIGFCESVYEKVFEKAYASFHLKNPGIHVNITVDGTVELLEMVNKNLIDAAIVIDDMLPSDKWNKWYSIKSSMNFVCSTGHELAERKQISVQDLNGQEFILMEEEAPYILNLNTWLAENNVSIISFLRLHSPATAIKMFSTGNYISLLPDFSIKTPLKNGVLKMLDVENFDQHQYVQFVLHKDKVLIPQIEAFLHEAKERFLSEQ